MRKFRKYIFHKKIWIYPIKDVKNGIKLKVKDNSPWLKENKAYTGIMFADLNEGQIEYDLPTGLTKKDIDYIEVSDKNLN